VSVNQTAGFSIATFTGTGANATVGHGLGVTPSMIIVKNKSLALGNWVVYFQTLVQSNSANYINLDQTNAVQTSPSPWNGTLATSSVFSIGTWDSVNGNGAGMVAYCFAAVKGYSAFGSYTGNGSTDGPFIFTGCRPRWLLLKNASGAVDWILYDTSRSTYNVTNLVLQPSQSAAEVSAVNVDVLSNGFKIRTTDQAANNSGQTYIYAAFAENPFNYSRAR
jgi:hypothetical protein